MKKLVLTSCVIITFGLYSLHERQGGSSVVLKPATPSNTSQAAQAPASSNNTNSGTPAATSATYKDGQYTGSTADAFYGYIQVLAVISGGKLTDVQFLQHPDENPNSININSQAMPYLKQEAIQAQSANVNIISGATDTSQAFIQSLSSALSQAHS
jgi:uncharacterized protein with FMN-binding domain